MANLPQPQLTDPATQSYMRNLVQSVETELNRRLESTTPVTSILMFSPDRAVWEITISNVGALVTTKVRDA